ncbi:MFS transporter [Altererythrobacter sp. MTPC7]|uniref:MFS transporter n=1 Tax=Erythrobacteraceae TaxID=335929 RepID=UPI0036F3FEC9
MSDATLADTTLQRAWPSLVENKPLRFAAVMILYFMQGVPLGLSLIVLPAWFAAAGASAVEIGGFVGFAVLPWSLKLFAGLLMDRFAYRPMGRRRAWILIAQGCLVTVLLALAAAAPDASQIALLASFCFALNMCAIFNDVAVDGMTIDLVPIEERGAINGCMFGSQIVGIAATSFIGGQMLVAGGTATTALFFAALVAVPSVIVSVFRERPGERLMPWTSGRPSTECEALQQDAWWPIIKGVFVSLADWRIVAYLTGYALFCANWVILDSVSPVLSVQELGWKSESYSSFAGTANLVAGLFGIAMTGLLVKWIGLSRMVTLVAVILVLLALTGGITYSSWDGSWLFSSILVSQTIAATLLTILLIAWGMMLSNPAVAASQFALIMAIPNLSRSMMAGISGQVVETYGYAAAYFIAAALTVVTIALCLFASSRISARVDAA